MLPVFLLVTSLASVVAGSNSPCLGYDVLCTTAGYQLRRYKESVWVGAQASGSFLVGTDMQPLYSYFTKENSKGTTIRTTGQTLVSLSGRTVLATYLMLSEELWDNPPTPTNHRVFITRFPVMNVFARIIHGFTFTKASDFNRTLTALKVNVNNSNYFVNSCLGTPIREWSVIDYLLHGQEIWFVATGRFNCPSP